MHHVGQLLGVEHRHPADELLALGTARQRVQRSARSPRPHRPRPEHDDATSDRLRDPTGQRTQLMTGVPGVSGEQLVTTLTGQHHLHVLARGSGQEVVGGLCVISDRLVEAPGEIGQDVGVVGGRHDHLAVLGAEPVSDGSGVRQLAVRTFGDAVEANRERAQRPMDVAARQRDDEAGVDAAAEERAVRHVAHELHRDRFVEEPVELADQLWFRGAAVLAGSVRQIPPPTEAHLSVSARDVVTRAVRRGRRRSSCAALARTGARGTSASAGIDIVRPTEGCSSSALISDAKTMDPLAFGVVQRLDPRVVARQEQRPLRARPTRRRRTSRADGARSRRRVPRTGGR